MKYKTLAEVAQAFKDGELDSAEDRMIVDNDTVDLHHGDEKVFSSDPNWVMHEALLLLGIPSDDA